MDYRISKSIDQLTRPSLPLTEVFDFLHLCQFDPHKRIAHIAFTRRVITVK